MAGSFLQQKLNERRDANALRTLRTSSGMADFCSNDYLGIATHRLNAHVPGELSAGAGGSRLLSGNYPLIEEAEKIIAAFHEAEAGLIFNSGYDANLGLMSAVASRSDTILYDQLSHASLRDGIRLSLASAHSFRHNDVQDLREKLKCGQGNVFVVTESLFSMDGDLGPLKEIATACEESGAHLIVDEAHATGIMGVEGGGLVQQLGLASACFARVHTFGKAVGAHGAIVLGSGELREFLINFARSFIFTTALPATAVQSILRSYQLFPGMHAERRTLDQLVQRFRAAAIPYQRIESNSPIQAIVVPGNNEVKQLAAVLQADGLDVRPILYPTVPRGAERLRIVLHAFNTEAELNRLIARLSLPSVP